MSWSRETLYWWTNDCWVPYRRRRSGPKNGWFPRDYHAYQDYFIDQARRELERRQKILDTRRSSRAPCRPIRTRSRSPAGSAGSGGWS